ncbi:MAG: hypothetical protein JSU87_05285 [Gemmatimonadota bacterium]|nr:MAG: hypothetical protein JSU87_05285 [Gemmatimonadota bacterium]
MRVMEFLDIHLGDMGRPVLPEIRTELRWQDTELWIARRPYPIDIPCPVCGAHTRCDFFGRQRCPQGHAFGQRAFWSGRANTCCLLLEDLRDGSMFVFPRTPLRWRDDARLVVAPRTAEQLGSEALP